MVSQQLFGEFCTVVDTAPDHWVKVKCSFDDYEGWCQDAHVAGIDEATFTSNDYALAAEHISELTFQNQPMLVPIGCSIRNISGAELQRNFKGRLWHPQTAERL
jgi:hypothetical protein